MVKKVEATIEKYGSLKNHKGVWGYQIRINGKKESILFKNYIVPSNREFLIKYGGTFESAKTVDIAHSRDEANKKAYKQIMDKPRKKLEKMMDISGLEKIIHDKHPVLSYEEVVSRKQ